MRPLTRARSTRLAGVVALAVAVAVPAGASAVTSGAAAAGSRVETIVLPGSGDVGVHWRGNGHGHGMSQYGARGAAIAGLSTTQILAFYYPGTTQTTRAAGTIRVLLSDAGADTTVWSGTPGLSVSGYGALPASGYSRFRLAPDGAGLRLAGLHAGSWHTLARHLPAQAWFESRAGFVRVAEPGGSSTSYRGEVGGVRSGASVLTINRVSLENYTAGVVPREMPASWQAAAVRAQAVAARTYAASELAAQHSGAYDICDSSQCQVYGGMAHYDSGGHLLYGDDQAALAGDRNVVLTYHGAPAFTQYSASDGGATVDGGKPYLTGKADPYDDSASGDPYLDQSWSVPVSQLAGYYGLRRVTSVRIDRRDGNGPWGGRVLVAHVDGVSASGTSTEVATTGFSLGFALGLGTDFVHFDATPTVPAAARSVAVRAGDAGATVSWQPPAATGGLPVTGYRLHFGGRTLAVAAPVRSAWVGPLANGRRATISVRAVNERGPGRPVTMSATPRPAPQGLVPTKPRKVIDSRAPASQVDPTHPLLLDVGDDPTPPPAAATAVVLSISVVTSTHSGVLGVFSSGSSPSRLAAIAYHRGRLATATVTVPLNPSRIPVLRPSTGQVVLTAYQQGYTAPGGMNVRPVTRQLAGTVGKVSTGSGTPVALAGLDGVSAQTRAVLVTVDAGSSTRTWLRLWRDGAAVPGTQQVSVGPGRPGVNTVLVPVGTSRRIRLAAGKPGVSARVVLVGVVGGNPGSPLESVPAYPLADDNAGARPAVAVGTSVTTRRVLGVGQVPARHVSAVLVEVTARSNGDRGELWVWPAGVRRGPAPGIAVPAAGAVTATVLLRVRSVRNLALQASVTGVSASLDVIGYVASG